MKKGHSLSALLIAVFLVIFVPSIQAGPWVPVASASGGLQGAAQVGSGGEGVGLIGLGPGTPMLQFKAGGHLLGFQPKKVYFASLDHALSVEFLGTLGVMPRTAAGGKETGKESKVSSLGRVVYEELWEGISLTYEAREGGIAESTYRIGPWADVSKIRLGYNVPVEVQRDGSLRFKFDRGYLTESSPEAWQQIGGERVPVAVAFRVMEGEVGFSVGKYDPNYPLTIDPTYAWHTFYGSSSNDYGNGIATDGSGNVYVTGSSLATWNGPAGQSPLHAYSGDYDIYVLKLSSSGTYQWHTFYGSSSNDFGNGIATDGSGNVYITGYSYATWNGPTGQSPFHAYSGSLEMFVLKLDSSGAYQWHTFYGSSSSDFGRGIATDGSGNVYITGESLASWNGPTGQIPLHAYSGPGDIYVLKLSSSGAYQWHTFYGSSSSDYSGGIATDGSGNVYVTGISDATWNGPASQSPLHAYSGLTEIFVLKLSSSGYYQWHTFYGSSNTETGVDDGYGIATDGSGNVYVTGMSDATWNGPAGENPLHGHSGSDDIFVLKLDSSGSYQWHTFYGSSTVDYGYGIATDGSRNVYVTGYSDATWNGPAGESPLHAYSGSPDIYVLKLSPAPISCDFDGDGKTDILWRHKTTGDNAVWLMNGTTWSNTVRLPAVTDTNWEIAGTGDFNNDGKTDILWRHKTDGRNSVWLMNGVNWSSTVSLPGVADTNWGIAGAGDFNNDGQVDILWRHKTDGRNSVWLMNGTTWSSTVSLPGVADTNWVIGGAGDFNNDGQVDILWRHKTDGRNAVWLMNGTTWSSTVSLPGVADTNWVIVGPR
jgi:hypothetical protein